MRSESNMSGAARSSLMHVAIAFVGLSLIVVAVHAFSGVRDLPNVRDEELMKVPIDALLQRGWSVETAIDYQEVKGPAFFWMYALPAEVLGGGINDLRLISVGCFLLGGLALLLIARECGLRRESIVLVALLYALAPYNAFTATLLMSEPSFTCVGLWMMLVFLKGLFTPSGGRQRVLLMAAFTILFAVLLHNRPHAVALGGAVAMVALIRERFRAWPWILACAIAAALRLPLYFRWGGLVTSNYQGLFGFGLRLDGLAYMMGAVLPWTFGWLIMPALVDRARSRATWLWMTIGFVGGALLATVGLPDLDSKVAYTVPATGADRAQIAFAGVLATALKAIVPGGVVRDVALVTCAGLGAASLIGLYLARPRIREERGDASRSAVVVQLAFWILACGIPLYVITAGPVYDRYLVVWMILMPIAWMTTLPRWLLAVQAVIYVGMAGYLLYDWIIAAPIPGG